VKDGSGRRRLSAARVRRALLWATPGQLDAGFASLSTFAAGIYAVRVLDIDSLGAYALLFGAFQMANQISTELVFLPSQILAVDLAPARRLGIVRHSVPRGSLLALASAILVPLGALPVRFSVAPSDLLLLSATAFALTAVSPLQDHLRAMFHMADLSWIAASMSAVHLFSTALTLPILGSNNPSLAPYGALFVGNCMSLGLAGLMIRRQRPSPASRPTWGELRGLGAWLLTTGLAKTGIGYASRTLLNAIAGVAALGFVEGARVVSQPINVLALGLMSQVGPRLMESAAAREDKRARSWRRRFLLLLAMGAVPYAAIAAGPWSFNPLATITPRAYQIPGLTAAMLVAVTLSCWLRPLRAELLGARKQGTVARTTVTTGVFEIVVIGVAVLIGEFAVPLAVGAAAILGVVLFHRSLASLYRSGAVDTVLLETRGT
jgi:O-antigen/teichoic acid export membrane protein